MEPPGNPVTPAALPIAEPKGVVKSVPGPEGDAYPPK